MRKLILLFDLDKTILDFDRAEKIALKRALMDFGLAADEQVLSLYHTINKRCWELLEEGKMTRQQVLVKRFEELFGRLGVAAEGAAVTKRYEKYLCEGYYYMPGAEELLDALDGKYEMYIVSNGSAVVQDARLESSGIGRYFKDIFISERIGSDKPSKAFFEACFARIPDFSADRAIIIGDSLTSDIRGGRSAGILSCWYNPKQELGRKDIVPDYQINNLIQLPALLEELSK